MLITKATQLIRDRKPYVIEVDNGARIPARIIVIATGAEYRRPPCKNLSRFEGAGVYYGATFVEAQLCGGEEVIVVGGGNSAGQAAVFLADRQPNYEARAHARQVIGFSREHVALPDSSDRRNCYDSVAAVYRDRRGRRRGSSRIRSLVQQSNGTDSRT
ncbi:MAG: FAD-dependent oxidoreductase [Candidatus Nitrosopolaris sp.]